MHDGATLRSRSPPDDYDPTDRGAALSYVRNAVRREEIPTGLFFVDADDKDLHQLSSTPW